MSGAVMIEPLLTAGLPPTQRKNWVRSISGTGSSSGLPNSRYASRCCGCWSTVFALNRLRVPSADSSPGISETVAQECVIGLPRYIATASPPSRRTISVSRSATRSRASSHEHSANEPSGCLMSGRVSRSGSSCRSCRASPFGHRYPRENGSCSSPRIDTTRLSATSMANPHDASHNVHCR